MKKILLILMLLAMTVSASATTLDVRVAAGADDILHISGDDVYNSTLRFGNEGGSTIYNSGMRFQNITIPQGATIDSAVIFFTSSSVTTGTTCNATINAEAIDDAAAFSNLSNYTGRSRTSASATWSSVEAWSVTTTTYLSVDFKSVVQEVVNRGGWASGNDIAVFVNNNSSSTDARRVAYNYENSSTLCPLLHIVYTVAAPTKRAAIVVENTAAVGVDTMLYNAIVNDLGYTCWYFDVDNIGSSPATYNSAYFDTAADVWISVGIEAALPSASTQCDSIANAATGYMAIGRDMWDEINLGTATAASTQSPKFKNLGLDHWITKVLGDTVRMYGNTTGANQYSIAIPDSVSSTDIKPLLISIYYAGDTSQAMLVAADSGARIFGTSGGPAGSHIAKGRRVFCGFFQNTSERPDSCQLWTIMLRSIAWLAKDTIGTILNRACFSGIEEIEWCSVVENSSGTDSIESYGTYDSNIGSDHDEKHAFVKIRNKALQRKFGSVYRAVDFSRVWMRLVYKGTGWDRAVPSVWSNSFTFQPIIRKWQVERKNCIASAISCPNACWTYAWIDTAANPDVYYAWGTGGARSYGTDTWDLKYDTLTITETTAIANTKFTIDMQPDSLGVRALDTLQNFGWASRMLASSSTPDDPDYGEMTFYGPANTNAITSIGIASPIINVTLSSFSTTVPTPTIAIATPSYDDDSVVFVGTYGQTFSPQDVVLSNSQGGALECATISDNSGGWLYLVASGTNMPITLNVYMIGQQVGYRSATVTITCADASNSPKTFKVAANLTSASARGATGKTIYR